VAKEFQMTRHLMALLFAVGMMAFPAVDAGPEALREGGHWKRLRDAAQARVTSNPNDMQAEYYLASAKYALGDLQGALSLAEKALSAEPNNARYHLLVADICVGLGQQAGIFKGLSLAKRFREEAEKAVALDPKFVEAREDLMEYYMGAPGIAGGDKRKAWAMADEIAQVDATRGLLAKAALSQDEKNSAKAEGFYQQALAAKPDDGRVLRSAATFYSSDSEKKYDLAEKYGLAAAKADETQEAPYIAVAVAYAAQERWQDLDALMARAQKNIPDDLGAWYQTAKLLLVTGKDLPRAERYFRQYLSMAPEGGEPPWSGAHWRLGLVLEKEGNKAQAVAEIEEAVREEPDFKAAKEDLKRLKK
jgi:tetratricopeptide (TPR) repeat protein